MDEVEPKGGAPEFGVEATFFWRAASAFVRNSSRKPMPGTRKERRLFLFAFEVTSCVNQPEAG
jgi:hypothetical protein